MDAMVHPQDFCPDSGLRAEDRGGVCVYMSVPHTCVSCVCLCIHICGVGTHVSVEGSAFYLSFTSKAEKALDSEL